MKTETLDVSGMHCASCASIIKRKIEKLEGVSECNVNYATEKANVAYDETSVTLDTMNDQIDNLGYTLSKVEKQTQKKHSSPHGDHDMMTPISSDSKIKEKKLKELSHLKKQVLIILPMVAVSIVVMTWEIGASPLNLWPKMPDIIMEFFHHLLPIFATYALFVVGIPYIQGMVRFFKYHVANMDSLVGIGTSVAFFYSFLVSAFENHLPAYINPEQNYYDVTIVVIGFITLGKYLESAAKLKTGTAIEKLLNMQAKKAIVLRNGQEIEIPIEELVVGDILIVKPGQKIPTDGVIIEGKSSIDESMITGESLPVDRNVGDNVIGSTINKQGSLKISATKVGSDTVISQIITMVEQAQGSKAPIERLADQVSAMFVPTVLVFSIAVFVSWVVFGSEFIPLSQAFTLGLLSFVGILVIACPCAMGLATPTAIIVGVGKAAEHGILIKNAENLERLSKIDYVVMDKTGTVTHGKPEVTDIIPVTQMHKKEIITLLSSLENHSEHPLAQAIVDMGKKEQVSNYPVEDFSAIEGKGLTGKIQKTEYFAGNISLARDLSIPLDDDVIDTFASQGKTPVIFMNKTEVIAYIAIADTIKQDAKHVIDTLHKRKIKIAMLTGDNKKTAEYIGNLVGIDTVIAEVLPSDKAQVIQNLQKDGHKVAMVGDGINDAVALAAADVGIAMGTGTDVAIESAGITLLGGNIAKIPKALDLSLATMRIIKQNLFWAFFYNILGIPIAAGILYPFLGMLLSPAVAGAAMGFSSVSVVANSLRLKNHKM